MQQTNSTQPTKFSLNDLEKILDEYFGKKAPAMPKGLKEFIVNIGPYITLVLMILLIPIVLAALGLSAIFVPIGFLGGARVGLTNAISLIMTVIVLVFEGLALPGLFAKSMKGWKFWFYASLVSALDNVLTMNLGGLIIGSVVSFWILFQVKEYYK